MSKLNELNELLRDYRRLNRDNPKLIVLGVESFSELRDLQRTGWVQLEFNYETNGTTFNGIRVLVSSENNYGEISFY